MAHPSAPSPAATSRYAAKAFVAPTTTASPDTDAVANFVGGFVAAEGTFVTSGDPPSFTFAVALGATDGGTCEALLAFFGAGHVGYYGRRKPHHDDVTCFYVRKLRDLIEVIVPFMDEHLPPSYKRQQYESWRAQLLDYWETRARRRRPCTIDGCDAPQRAHGVCRRHLYALHGK